MRGAFHPGSAFGVFSHVPSHENAHYSVNVGEPGPRFGKMLVEQFGGANGELAELGPLLA